MKDNKHRKGGESKKNIAATNKTTMIFQQDEQKAEFTKGDKRVMIETWDM